MIDLNEPIFVCTHFVDMRKSIDGLTILVSAFTSAQEKPVDKSVPFTSAAFVFTNRSRDKIKILVKESNGFCLFYKRLDRGSFKINLGAKRPLQLTKQQLRWLLYGLDYASIKCSKSPLYSLTF